MKLCVWFFYFTLMWKTQDGITSLDGEHTISLAQSHFIEVCIPLQEVSGHLYVC